MLHSANIKKKKKEKRKYYIHENDKLFTTSNEPLCILYTHVLCTTVHSRTHHIIIIGKVTFEMYITPRIE